MILLQKTQFRSLQISTLAILFFFACSQWDFDRIGFTRVVTVGAIEVGSNSAFLIGDIEDLRSSSILERGFILSTDATDHESLQLDRSGVLKFLSPGQDTIKENQAFAARAIGLSGSTEYFFRAYAKILGEEQVVYGTIDHFKTLNVSIELKNITRSSEDCNTTAIVEVLIDGFVPGTQAEVGVLYTNRVFIGEPSQLNGSILSESTPGTSPGSFLFSLPVECEQNYTVVAFTEPPSSQRFYSDLRSFSMTESGAWVPKSSFPGEMRDFPADFSLENAMYLGAGKRAFQRGWSEQFFLFDFWKYSATDDAWSLIGQFEDGVSGSFGSSSDGLGYFGSGQWTSERCLDFSGGICEATTNHCMTSDFFKFDPANQSWRKIELTDSIDGKFRRHSATAINIGSKIYLGFGSSSTACGSILRWISDFDFPDVINQVNNFFTFSDMWQFDPSTESWKEMQPFPKEERVQAIGFSVGNKGYFGMGSYYRAVEGQTNPQVGPLTDFFEFDPSQPDGSQWVLLESFPQNVEFAKSFAIGNLGYVLGVSDYIRSTPVQVWQFDRNNGVQGTWSQLSQNIQPGFEGLPSATFSIGNVAFIYFAGPDQNFWMYVPELI